MLEHTSTVADLMSEETGILIVLEGLSSIDLTIDFLRSSFLSGSLGGSGGFIKFCLLSKVRYVSGEGLNT